MIDDLDTFGRVRWHRDLGMHAFAYRYNGAGLLSQQTSLASDGAPSGISTTGLLYTGQDISYIYDKGSKRVSKMRREGNVWKMDAIVTPDMIMSSQEMDFSRQG